MRKVILLVVFCFVGAVTAFGGRYGEMDCLRVGVTVGNDCVGEKLDAPVVVRLRDVVGKDFVVGSAVVRDENGCIVPCQLDDMDGDSRADEVFLLLNLRGGETKELVMELRRKVKIDDGGAPGTTKTLEPTERLYTALQLRDKDGKHPDVLRVEARGSSNIFNDIYMHGITVESEMVGYRIYFDHRQNIDLYGKCFRRIELPVTQFYTTAEQLKDGYGVDVLWAGSAIGCGSFKDWKEGRFENWTDVAVRGQRIVTTGALRTVVEVYDLGVDGCYDMHQLYSLYAGHRDMRVDIAFDGEYDEKTFCTGVQKVGVAAEDSVRRGHSPEGFVRKDGMAASWGCDYPDMGKKQQWAPEAIGLAIDVPKEYVVDVHEDDLNYLFTVRPVNGHLSYSVSFCADKEKTGYHSAREWFESLDEWKDAVSRPVTVKLKKLKMK